MQNETTTRYHLRKLPTCGPLTHSKSVTGGEISKRLTRSELEDACRRHKAKEIAAMAASRKREAISVQNQRTTNRGIDKVDASSQLHVLDVGVKLCARKYNESKAQADKLNDEVKSLCDDVIELERESTALHEMLEGKHSEAQKITMLSADIKEAHDCSEWTLMYRHQLHHMHNRISKNSIILDGHIGEMSATLATAHKEKERSQKMLAEVESAVTFASIELDETIRDTNMAEGERNRELTIKQLEAGDTSRIERWNSARINSNLSVQQHLAGADKLERDRIQRLIRDREEKLKELNNSTEEMTVKLAELEGCFLQLKQATGVNCLAEIVAKISSHEENRQQLLKEKKEAEERLLAAKATFSSNQEALDKIKTNGLGGTELSRDVIKRIKTDIYNEKSEGKIVKSTNARLEALLVGLRQGGIGLYNRLLPYHSDLLNEEAPKLGEIDSTNTVQAASDTLEMINFTEKILGKMLIDIGGIRFVDTKSDIEKDGTPESPRLNCRIRPKFNVDEDDNTTVKTSIDEYGDSPRDVPSRNKLKKNSEKCSIEAVKLLELKSTKSKLKSSLQPRDDSTDDNAQNSMALTPVPIKKAARLSSPSSLRAKPIGPREDPLDRVHAFLTELPCLD
ncbi:hypothetical protein HJC23_005767 [Cyclotella cryptica]|uniref:Cilia- and flagella-associated protein 157 n=1 Tax=Cyclotella cryptica TaxID=29204 RepID=A0ABD3NFC7_9STRA